jgi:hypothetical protein
MSTLSAGVTPELTGWLSLHQTVLRLLFGGCEQTFWTSSNFVSGDRVHHLGLRFAGRRHHRTIWLATRRDCSWGKNSRRGQLFTRPSWVQRKCPLVILPVDVEPLGRAP